MKLIFTLGFLASFILISAQTVCIETDTITIDSIPSGLYSAEKVLSTASYIQDSSSVVLAANDSILLMPGFTVGPGASFQALNSGCQNMATLKPNVVVVNDNSDDGLIYIATDTLIFLDTVPQLNQFLNDCIITSGITDNAPLGYLRKITNVHTSGGQTTLTTQNATLSDALDFVDFNFEMDLVDPGFAPPGNVTAAKNLNAAFSFNLPDYPVNNFITLSGGITVDPDFVFELTQFEGLDEPTNFKIGTKGTISYNVDITFSPTGSANINEIIELYEKQLTPFTACIPLPPPILCFPVVIVPELEVKLILQLDGPTVEYHYENSGEFMAVLKKIGDNWTNDHTNNLTFSGGV